MFANFREQIARAEQCIDIAIALSSRACSDARVLQGSLIFMRQEVEQINHAAMKARHSNDLEYAVKALEKHNRGILEFRQHEMAVPSKNRKEAIHAVDEAHHATAQLIDSLQERLHH